MLTKTNFAGYEKDTASNLVINKNKDEFALYQQNRERAKQFKIMTKQLENLIREVAELRTIVHEVTKPKSGNE